jgi:arylsulfatase A-like enzyme
MSEKKKIMFAKIYSWKKICLHLITLVMIFPSIFCHTIRSQSQPNIVFIISDDHAFQAIGAYGGKLMPTPNIDRIAKEGAIFRNSFVTNSICGPSRATLLTGKYSHKNGYPLNEQRFDVNQFLFSRLLQQNNYQTAWIGKWHLGNLPKGFDHFEILKGQGNYYNPDLINTNNDTVRQIGYVTDIITEKSLAWLDQRVQNKPFFLVIGEKATHREWIPDIQDLGAFDAVEFPLPSNFFDDYKGRDAAMHQDMSIDQTMRMKEDVKVHLDYNAGEFKRLNEEQRSWIKKYYDDITKEFDNKKLTGKELAIWKYQRYMKDYLSVARSMDRNIGKVLSYLDQHNLVNNTVVVYLSDQGFYLGEHGWFDKRFMYEQSLRTPFVMRYPGVIKPGLNIDRFASNIDWAPTVLDLAGVGIPADIQGVSLVPLLKNPIQAKWKDELYYHYYEYPDPHRVSPHFGIRTPAYKLIRFYGAENGWEFYDLQKDPSEMHNAFNEKKYVKIIKELKAELIILIDKYQDEDAKAILSKAN